MDSGQTKQKTRDAQEETKRQARKAQDKTQRGAEQAERAIAHHPLYRGLVRVGLVSYGIVHLLLAWLAGQLALGGGSGEQADNSGAMAELASQPFGEVLLVVVAVGLFTLVLWQLLQAVLGHLDQTGHKRVVKRVASAAKAVLYAVLGVTAVRTTMGDSGGGDTEESATAQLLSQPLGMVLVLLVAAVVAGIGVAQIVKGVRRTFCEDLVGQPGPAATGLGVAGHVTKGLALLVVGGLFAAAALTHDPEQAGGMDVALQTVRQQPYGVVLLLLMALGLAAYGLYCFAWARRPKHV